MVFVNLRGKSPLLMAHEVVSYHIPVFSGGIPIVSLPQGHKVRSQHLATAHMRFRPQVYPVDGSSPKEVDPARFARNLLGVVNIVTWQ